MVRITAYPGCRPIGERSCMHASQRMLTFGRRFFIRYRTRHVLSQSSQNCLALSVFVVHVIYFFGPAKDAWLRSVRVWPCHVLPAHCPDSRDACSRLRFSLLVSSTSFLYLNAPKLIYSKVRLENFPGGNTPGPPLLEWVTPSRTHPQHGLRPCAVATRPIGSREHSHHCVAPTSKNPGSALG